MRIVVNGEPREVEAGITVAALIQNLEFEGKRLAVEVNEEIVPRGEHPGRSLREGDRVEIVRAIGGG